MPRGEEIKPPFFNIGGKAYKYGNEMLDLALKADEISARYEVDIILSPQPTDMRMISKKTEFIYLFAQHMDAKNAGGRGHGAILPEAIKDAGGSGAVINHAEKLLKFSEICRLTERAAETGLYTMICVENVKEAKAAANLGPELILSEPPELIGTGKTGDEDFIKKTSEAVKEINSDILVQYGAGISDGADIFDPVAAGAEGVGSASGIMQADRPLAKVEEMISATRQAWNKFHR